MMLKPTTNKQKIYPSHLTHLILGQEAILKPPEMAKTLPMYLLNRHSNFKN